MKKTFTVIAAMLLLAGTALAQGTAQGGEAAPPEELQEKLAAALAQGAAQAGSSQENNQTFTFIEKLPTTNKPRPEDLHFVDLLAETKTVKNAPYTATEVTESTQMLSDGNRIVNKTTAAVARDSEGRTRREENAVSVGGLQASGPKIVTIYDPVAHAQYIFQSNDSSGGSGANSGEGAGTGSGSGNGFPHGFPKKVRVFNISENSATGKVEFGTTNERGTESYFTVVDGPEDEDVKHESLGTQMIEGVNAEGTRETRTIAAGTIGNERPIVITSETWTSPELHRVVLSKRNDPRFGETVYKLTNITRGEPDPSSFQAPSNVKKDVPRK